MNSYIRTVYVDADACPVKEEIVDICEKHTIRMVFVSSYAHQLHLPSSAEVKTVDSEKEAVDLYVMNHAVKEDICVTQDHALASILLSKGVRVLSPRGIVYREETIDQLLDTRYHGQKQRRMGAKTKGPKPFTKEDRTRFVEQFTEIFLI